MNGGGAAPIVAAAMMRARFSIMTAVARVAADVAAAALFAGRG